jgi:ABC-type transport system involved in multi-copper enzyme maturation permease subunit
MASVLKAEFYKLSLNTTYRASLAVCLVLTVTFGLLANSNTPDSAIDSFVGQIIPLVDIFYIDACLIIGSIWSMEYSGRTMGDLFIAGKPRALVFLSKYLSSCIAISSIYLLCSAAVIMFSVTVSGFSQDQVFALVKPLMLQWVLLLAVSSIFILAAIITRRYSYLTVLMITLYLFFRGLASMLNRGDFPEVLERLSYIDLHYRAIASASIVDSVLVIDCMVFAIFIPVCFMMGFIIFRKQEF